MACLHLANISEDDVNSAAQKPGCVSPHRGDGDGDGDGGGGCGGGDGGAGQK